MQRLLRPVDSVPLALVNKRIMSRVQLCPPGDATVLRRKWFIMLHIPSR